MKPSYPEVPWPLLRSQRCTFLKGPLLSFLLTLGGFPFPTLLGQQVAAWGQLDGYYPQFADGLTNVQSIAAGNHHDLALKTDGSVVAWGNNSSFQVALPAGLTNVVAIAAGYETSMALRSDGTVVVWGLQVGPAPTLSHVVAIAAGERHCLALKQDGTVIAWGDNRQGQLNLPSGLTNIISIASGGSHSLALKADGSVVAWGGNDYGKATVPPLGRVIGIAAGRLHSMALLADGTVVAWGNNDYRQCQVPAHLTAVKAIAAGHLHSMALSEDGTVAAWGNESAGLTSVPAGLVEVTAIAGGGSHCLALTPRGPVQINQNPPSLSVVRGSSASLAVRTTGTAPISYQWYSGDYVLNEGAHVQGTTNATLHLSDVQFWQAGPYSVIASNAFGALRSEEVTLDVTGPPIFLSQSPHQTVLAGSDVQLQVTADGRSGVNYQWRHDGVDLPVGSTPILFLPDVQDADAGNYSVLISNLEGSTLSSNIMLTVQPSPPRLLSSLANRQATIGGSTMLAVDVRGTRPLRFQWSFNGAPLPGETNPALKLGPLRYDQAGYYHLAASNPAGELVTTKVQLSVVQVLVWGARPSLNLPTNTPPGLTNVVAVSAGGRHVLALKADGTVTSWANPNISGLPSVPSELNEVQAIAAGYAHNLALKNDGTVVTWSSSPGLTNLPAGLANVIAISTSVDRYGGSSLALKDDGTVTSWGQPAIPIPSSLTNVVAVSARSTFSRVLTQSGTVLECANPVWRSTPLSNVISIPSTWGNLALRQDGNRSNWVAVAGGACSMGLRADGSAQPVWSNPTDYPLPAGLSNVIAIACGGSDIDPGFFVAVVGDGSPHFTLQPMGRRAAPGSTHSLHARAVGGQPMTYQWQRDGRELPGATASSLTITNFQAAESGAYRVVVANTLGSATSAVARVDLVVPLPSALDAPTLDWSSAGSDTPWFGQPGTSHDGQAAGQSGIISAGRQSTIATTLIGPGSLSFWWKTSSEETFDRLSFYLDVASAPCAAISGETDWAVNRIIIPEGTHQIWWTYNKDNTVSFGQDAAWLDQVNYRPDPPVIQRQPQSVSVTAGNTTVMQTVVTGGGPLAYQWLKNGEDWVGMNQPTLRFPPATRHDAGLYAVRVSNASGTALSSNATLTVSSPQLLRMGARQPDGRWTLASGDADGALLRPEETSLIELQISTNLVDWLPLPTPARFTNGLLQWHEADPSNWPVRFYRTMER